jgi:hypothetical protein
MAETLRSDKNEKTSRAETKPSDLIPEAEDLLTVEIEEAAKPKASSRSSMRLEENVAPSGDVDPDDGPGFATYTGAPEKSSLRFVPAVIIGSLGLIAAAAAIWVLTKKEPEPKANALKTPAVTEPEPVDDAVGALIKVADAKFVSGQITGEGGALAILLKAKAESPNDERVSIRLLPLADKFQDLGDEALKSERLEEAAAHFQLALDADPSRQELTKKLEEIRSQL